MSHPAESTPERTEHAPSAARFKQRSGRELAAPGLVRFHSAHHGLALRLPVRARRAAATVITRL
jgi:hypothetical protein